MFRRRAISHPHPGRLIRTSTLALVLLCSCQDTARWTQPEGIPRYPGGTPPVGFAQPRSPRTDASPQRSTQSGQEEEAEPSERAATSTGTEAATPDDEAGLDTATGINPYAPAMQQQDRGRDDDGRDQQPETTDDDGREQQHETTDDDGREQQHGANDDERAGGGR